MTAPSAANISTASSTASSTENDNEPAKRDSKRCGLSQCRKAECNLRSHRQFVASRRKAYSLGWTAGTEQPANSVLDHSALRVERLISNGFPTLPFKHEGSSVFRQLAQHYFSDQIDRLIQIFSPHLDRRTYKATMMDHALSNDVFCVCITANAKTDMLMRGHIRIPDRTSEMVYAATASILRRKLVAFKPTDLDWLLVLVVALVGFDLSFEKTDSLRGHHEALRQLVAMKGGIHTVGHTVWYVLNTDRFLAVFTGQYPIFRQYPILRQSIMFPRPQNEQSLAPYGAAFKRLKLTNSLDGPVLDLCLENCQIIHLIETAQISFNPKSPPALIPSAIPYFLYLRDRISCQGAVLHADYHENQNPTEPTDNGDIDMKDGQRGRTLSVSRCVLLALLIIEYVTLHANYYTIKGTYLATQLKSILEKQPNTHWKDYPDVLVWVTFTLAAVPDYWDEHRWAVWKLKQCLDTKYKKKWPTTSWKDEVLKILREHMWAETLETAFRKTCDELLVNST